MAFQTSIYVCIILIACITAATSGNFAVADQMGPTDLSHTIRPPVLPVNVQEPTQRLRKMTCDSIISCFCSRGHFCPGKNASRAVACPISTFLDRRDATRIQDCQSCPAGKFCNVSGLITPQDCPSGTLCPTGSLHPQPCPMGSFCPGPAGEAQTCPERYFCPQNASEPIPCPPGTFSRAFNATVCQACPDGTFTPFTRANGNCKPWSMCRAGTFISANATKSTDNICTPCPAGTYWPYSNASTHVCSRCPLGEVSAPGSQACGAAPSPSPSPTSTPVPQVSSPSSSKTRAGGSDGSYSQPLSIVAIAGIVAGCAVVVAVVVTAGCFYQSKMLSRPGFRLGKRPRVDESRSVELSFTQTNPAARSPRVLSRGPPPGLARDLDEDVLELAHPSHSI